MSSVDFRKCKGGTEGWSKIAHATRHDGDLDVDYRNKYIDKTKTHLNYCIGLSNGMTPTAKMIHNYLLSRVDQIDQLLPPKRKRKDRVKEMSYTIAVPEGLPLSDQRRFFEIAYEELACFSGGKENISPGFIHMDEIHDYVASDGSVVKSRPHMHVIGIPYVGGVGVNGKQFETRVRMRELNKAIDDRCKRELGISFMTGKKGLSGRSVEELQADSETRALRLAIASNKALIAEQEAYLAEQRETHSSLSEAVKLLAADKEKLLSEIGDLGYIRDFAQTRLEQIQKMAKKIPSPVANLRYRVETKDDLIDHKALRQIDDDHYVPADLDGHDLTWAGCTPVYRSGHIGYQPVYYLDPSGHPCYGDWSPFQKANRDLLETEKPRTVLSDQLQREVDICRSVVADIDRIKTGKSKVL